MVTRRTNTRKKITKKRKETSSIDSELDAIYLPEGDTIEPSDNLLDYCVLLYGESGIGKTSTVSKIPGVYMLQLDPNRKGLSIRQSNIDNKTLLDLNKERPTYTPWDIIVGLINRACDDPSVKCVAIDNFGLFYEHAFRHKCYRLQIADPSAQNDFGQTWRDIEEEMTTALNKILIAGKGVVVIAHEKTKEVELVSETYERTEPAVMKAAFKWLKACTDFAFYLSYGDSGDRVIHMRGAKEIWLKCCTDEDNFHFMDPQGKPLNQISAGASPLEAWENICAAWENTIQDIEYDPNPKRSKTKKTRKQSPRKIKAE